MSTNTNPNFNPTHSTNDIWRDQTDTRCLTDDLDDMDDAIANLNSGKSPINHTHTEYASTNHTHTEYAGSSHTHSQYALTDHTHSGYSLTTHNHNSEYALVNHSHSGYSLTTHDHNGTYATADHAHTNYAVTTHNHDTVYSKTDHTHSYNDLNDKPTIPTVPSSLPANGGNADTVDNKHASDFATATHTHTGFAADNHDHDTDYISKALLFLNDSGGVEFSYGADSGKNLLTEISAMSQGVHTIYSIAGTGGNPNTTDSWRFLVHKTATDFGWVIGFANSGSVYSNYLDTGNWLGWRVLHDANPTALWTGSWYMNASHTVTPSKSLSECKNGWILVWSDFNTTDNTVVNSEACTTVIPKRGFNGAKWTGQSFLTVVPAAINESSDAITIKRIQVYDAKLTGHAYNTVSPRNDIVLRAVYEF